jgi:hypothetical protein
MKPFVLLIAITSAAFAQSTAAEAAKPAVPAVGNILQIKRVYVEALSGNDSAEAIRELVIATLEQSHLFAVTDNPDRADVVLKGAANDAVFTDTFDSYNGATSRGSLGGYSGKLSGLKGSSGGLAGSTTAGENDSEHMRERKHEAYVTVRLCNKDGDVLWATTQESRGAKFHSASADVAEKVMHQLQTDYAKAARDAAQTSAAGNASH